MVGKAALVVLALTTVFQLLTSSGNAAPTDSQSCRHHYQEALTKALKIRKTCENAAFQDCCQVGWSFSNLIHRLPLLHSIPNTCGLSMEQSNMCCVFFPVGRESFIPVWYSRDQ